MIINLKDARKEMDVVYVTDFDDGYHDEFVKVSTELEAKARRIRRRYKDVIEFIQAKAIYEEYMQFIYDQFPTKQIAKQSIRSGFYRGFVPSKPRMKNKSEAYQLMKKGIVLSSVNWKHTDIQDALEAQRELQREIDHPMKMSGSMSEKKYKKIAEGVKFKGSLDTTMDDIGSVSDFALIQSYFERKAKAGGVGLEDGDSYDPSIIPIHRMLDDDFYEAEMDTTDEDQIISYNGRYITQGEYKGLAVYDQLGQLGYDSIKLMKNKGGNLSGGARRMAKLTKKRNKRAKKAEKKRDKNLMSASGVIAHDSFDDWEKTMLDFSFKK